MAVFGLRLSDSVPLRRAGGGVQWTTVMMLMRMLMLDAIGICSCCEGLGRAGDG